MNVMLRLEYKESYLAASREDIAIIDSPVGLPGRVVKNKFVQQIMDGEAKPFKCPWKCLASCNYKEAPFCIAQALFNSARGNLDEGFAFAGANAYMATEINHVSDVITDLVSGYKTRIFSASTINTYALLKHMYTSRCCVK